MGRSRNTTCAGFEARECARQKAMMSVVGGNGAGLQHDEGAGRLAPFLVGPGDDGDFEHGGMLDEHALDLDGRDVLAARDDDVLAAVLQLDIAVGVPHAEIAGVEPAVRRTPRRVAEGFFR